MSDITKIKMYILFFNPNSFVEINDIKIETDSDYYENGKAENYLFYYFDKNGNGSFTIKKFLNEEYSTFKDFHKKLKEKFENNIFLGTSGGYIYELSDLDDQQFIDLHKFNREIIRNKTCDDIWMNTIIISPIALFLSNQKKFARGEFIGANENINPKAFLLEYPSDDTPDNKIKKLIIQGQKELKKYPVFMQYSYQENKLIDEYVNRIFEIIKINKTKSEAMLNV